MKTITLALIAIFFSLSSFAQSQKVTIYCFVNEFGQPKYGDLAKWLPDSTQKKVFVPMKRDFHAAKGNVIMYMNLHGWKLASTEFDAGIADYIFSRDIEVDDKTMAALNGVLSSLNPNQKK